MLALELFSGGAAFFDASVREAAGTGDGGDFGAIRSDLGGRDAKRWDCAGLSKPGAKRRRRGRHQAGAGARSGARLFVPLAP